MHRPPQPPTLFPYTTLFRSRRSNDRVGGEPAMKVDRRRLLRTLTAIPIVGGTLAILSPLLRFLKPNDGPYQVRSEEHTSELQSHVNLVCRLLLEKKN